MKLHSIFEQQTKQAAHVVQVEYFSFCMDPSDDMVAHIAKFEGLILRMQQLNVKSDVSSIMVKLLDTLPEEYENLRQAWWVRSDDQQTFENLVALLTSDEKRKQQNRKQGLTLAVAQAKSQVKGEHENKTSNKCQQKSTSEKIRINKKKLFKCYGCGETGYIRRNCLNIKPKRTIDVEQAYVSESLDINMMIDHGLWILVQSIT